MADGGLRGVFLDTRPMLLRLLVARLGSREEAEDVLQDLWLRIDELAERPVSQPAGFLYRVAANMATDRRIALARHAARDAAWVEVQPAASEAPDSERMLIGLERLQAVEATMQAMPERMHAALRLFRIEDRPQREIAATLGISVSGVEKLLQRAYRLIHDAVAEIDAEMPGRCRLEGKGDFHRGI